MTAKELRKKYLDFFVKKGHQVIPNVSLIPENDPTALFISAGMHPLVPYLLGEPHPLGKRLVSNQRCLRTDDIDEVGDAFHHTFFEMLGNWSLGDYWKDKAIEWSFEFLTKELKLDPKRLYVSCFGGDKDAPRDEESAKIWQEVGIPQERIYFYGKAENWWGPAGKTGPCGPDTEMFYDVTEKPCGPKCHPNDNCGRFFEIWNDVFMQYNKTKEGKYESLKQKNVDTGMGVERTVAALSGLDDDYQTELFSPIIRKIEEISGKKYQENPKEFRIIADHLRAATFLIGDGVLVSNVGHGYILRRLIRRAIVNFEKIKTKKEISVIETTDSITDCYKEAYPHLGEIRDGIKNALKNEETKFIAVFSPKRVKQVESELITIKNKNLPIPETIQQIGRLTFNSLATYGIPSDYTLDKAVEFGLISTRLERSEAESVVKEDLQKHQKLSRTASAGMFAGGLADHSETVTKYHTATHLLNAALRQVLGPHVFQKGSNITSERLRFDFPNPRKLTEEELKNTEDLVNQKIKDNLPVKMEMMTLEEAKKRGAAAVFGEKYGEKVKVYQINSFSVEVCGGPHVLFTGELGKFKIIKEEAVGAGVRRLYAVLE